MGSRQQNTLRKDRSKHFFGRAARLASCLLVYSDRVNKSQTGVSSYHLKLPNKNIMLHVSGTKTRILLAVYSRSNLIGVTYIHLSLTHSLIH